MLEYVFDPDKTYNLLDHIDDIKNPLQKLTLEIRNFPHFWDPSPMLSVGCCATADGSGLVQLETCNKRKMIAN